MILNTRKLRLKVHLAVPEQSHQGAWLVLPCSRPLLPHSFLYFQKRCDRSCNHGRNTIKECKSPLIGSRSACMERSLRNRVQYSGILGDEKTIQRFQKNKQEGGSRRICRNDHSQKRPWLCSERTARVGTRGARRGTWAS